MARLLASTKLAIALLLVLASVGIAGSLLYRGNTAAGRFGAFNVFRSPLFVVPALLLAVNIAFCASRRIARAPRGVLRTWTFAGMHAGLLLLAGGMAADGLAGFVGTQYYHVGIPRDGYFNWRTNRDERFPFTVEVADIGVRYHPLNLQVGVRDAAGAKVGLFTVREGVSFRAGRGTDGIVVTPRSFDIATRTLVFDAEAKGEAVNGATAGPDGSPPVGGYTVVPVTWHDPEPKEYAVRTRFARPGRTPEEMVIRVNAPARVEGLSFCLVGLDADPYRNTIVGLQVSREPGAPFFWAGGILFGLSFLLHYYVRRTAAGEAGVAEGDAPAREAEGIPRAKALLLAALFLAVTGPLALADSPPAGLVISGEDTWEGEVRVTAPVSVAKGATLRIRPGTRVLLSGEDGDGDGCRDGAIEVLGTLLVEGTREKPVLFGRLHPDLPWREIFLSGAVGRVRHAVFEGAQWGIHSHEGDLRVEQALFRGNGGGARLKGRGASFSRCTFRDNDIGLRFWEGGPTVTASVIARNGTGIFYRDGAGGGRLSGNVIANREWDVKIGEWAAGDLDAAENYWGEPGGPASAPRVADFRDDRAKGRIAVDRALPGPPRECGADLSPAGAS